MAKFVGVAASKGKTPTYPLVDVIRLSGDPTRRFVTVKAGDTAWAELSMTKDAIFRVVASLVERDFFKTMPCDSNPELYQDVYHAFAKSPRDPRGVLIYCKVQVLDDRLTVISFKRK